jgi:hypothetical protein
MNTVPWRTQNATWLTLQLRCLRLRLQRHALRLRSRAPAGLVADWLLAGEDSSALAERDEEIQVLDEDIAAREDEIQQLGTRMAAEAAPSALEMISELAGLSRLECQLLLLAAAPALDGAFAPAYAEIHADSRRDRATLHLALSLFASPPDRIISADCLLPLRPLRRLRLLDLVDEEEPLMLRGLTVGDRVTDYLRGINRMDSRLEPFLRQPPPVIPGGTAPAVAARAATLMQGESERWPLVNFVGAADGGPVQAAVLTCGELDLQPRRVDLVRLAAAEQRTAAIELLGREALLGGLALIADATELHYGTEPALALDELICTVGAPLLIASRERWPCAEPGIHTVLVAKADRMEQQGLWERVLASFPNSVNGQLEGIVQQFDFGPAAIADVVARAALAAEEGITGQDLWEACRAQSSVGLDNLTDRVRPCFDWDDLVVGEDVRGQLGELAEQVRQRTRVYETWGFAAQLARGRGITALFAGPSGTGKTMAAEILAAHLRLDLHRVDLAGIVSKYIGETEKNLRRVFEAAEGAGSILFFDEADSLFGSRTEVRDSHDRYANLEINYLLQRMEDYTGLAILATNRRSSLDTAFLRRLRFVIEFPFPLAEDRRRIWERVFPPQAELGAIDCGALSRLEISGGSIRCIALNAAFLASADGSPIEMEHIMRSAAREYAKLAKPISAAEFGGWHAVARP